MTPAPALRALPVPVPGRPYRVVFVCTGNICRSPMAEVITATMAASTTLVDGTSLGAHLIITSAGTDGWHEGEPMDPRTGAALRRAGYPDHAHVAHQISAAALGQADLVVALDRGHQRTLHNLGRNSSHVALLRSFDRSAGAAVDVPDPYYGDAAGFDDCLRLIALGCQGLVSGLAALWDTALSP